MIDTLGLVHGDLRGLTLTGGMPYFAERGNSYNMHAFGVYPVSPPKTAFTLAKNISSDIVDVDSSGVYLNEHLSGPATIELYAAIFDKLNHPRKAIIIARHENNHRCLAGTDDSRRLLSDCLLAKLWAGKKSL